MGQEQNVGLLSVFFLTCLLIAFALGLWMGPKVYAKSTPKGDLESAKLTAWFDTNGCTQFHEIKTHPTRLGLAIYHSTGEECPDCEYNFEGLF